MKYRKKPIVIEALQLTKVNLSKVAEWSGASSFEGEMLDCPPYIQIATLEGVMRGELGDYIIKGIQGEFYPCKSDIFEASYEPAE
jgi:hypothetical protein